MSSHHHVLITLFNIRYSLSSDLDGLANWTDERFPIFEKYCFPSIKAQSNQDFDWLIIIDSSTKKEQRSRLRNLIDQRPRTFIIEYEDWDSIEIPINDWIQTKHPKLKHLITSRVDNDDVLHQDFINKVRNIADSQEEECLINFTNGYCMQLRKENHLLYEFNFLDNSFMSFVEPMQIPLKTIRKYNHDCWPQETIRLNEVTDVPLWMQLIHGKNVRNRIWGRAVPNPTQLEAFQLNNDKASHNSTMPHQLQVLKYHLSRPIKKLRSIMNQEPY